MPSKSCVWCVCGVYAQVKLYPIVKILTHVLHDVLEVSKDTVIVIVSDLASKTGYFWTCN
jgi:phenylpyruvate tautomerase PptA (4-oxalocrotonate tautomerase family)